MFQKNFKNQKNDIENQNFAIFVEVLNILVGLNKGCSEKEL